MNTLYICEMDTLFRQNEFVNAVSETSFRKTFRKIVENKLNWRTTKIGEKNLPADILDEVTTLHVDRVLFRGKLREEKQVCLIILFGRWSKAALSSRNRTCDNLKDKTFWRGAEGDGGGAAKSTATAEADCI